MRRVIVIYVVSALGLTLFQAAAASAQPRFARQPLNRWSIDVQTGWSMPFSPRIAAGEGEKSPFKDYNRLGAWQVGMRYMLIPQLGVRPHYSYNGFGSSAIGQLHMHQYGLDLVANLADAFRPVYAFRPRRFNLLLHGGGTLTSANSGQKDVLGRLDSDKLISLRFGTTAQYRIDSHIALYFDLASQLTFLEDLGYDGQSSLIQRNDRLTVTGFILTPSIGLSLYLGRERQHADWR